MLGSLSRGARLTGLVLALAAGLTGCTAGSRSTAAPPASAASTTRASTPSSATPSGTQARASNDARAAAGTAAAASPGPRTATATGLTATTLGWRLPTPLSRMVALAAPGGGLELAGGLLNGDHSSARVLHIDLPSGAVTDDGILATGVHDSAGAVLGGRLLRVRRRRGHRGIGHPAPGTGRYGNAGRSPARAAVRPGRGGRGRQGRRARRLQRVGDPGRCAREQRWRPLHRAGKASGAGSLPSRRRTRDGHLPVRRRRGQASHRRDPAGLALVQGPQPWWAICPAPPGTQLRWSWAVRCGWPAVQRRPVRRTASIVRWTGVTFAPAGRLPGPRADMGVVVAGGLGYLIGGETPARTSSVVSLRPTP